MGPVGHLREVGVERTWCPVWACVRCLEEGLRKQDFLFLGLDAIRKWR